MPVKEAAAGSAETAHKSESEAAAAHVATVVGLLPDGTPELALPGIGARVRARLAIATSRARLEAAIMLQQQVVVVFERGDRSRPIIIGFIERLEPEPSSAAATAQAPLVEADVDGRRV